MTNPICKNCHVQLLSVFVSKTVNRHRLSDRIQDIFYCPNCDEFKEKKMIVKFRRTK